MNKAIKSLPRFDSKKKRGRQASLFLLGFAYQLRQLNSLNAD
jgi:hypothetical protein